VSAELLLPWTARSANSWFARRFAEHALAESQAAAGVANPIIAVLQDV